MKAFLIDPTQRSVTEVEYTGDYKNIYAHINATTFDAIRMEEGDAVFVDDEGLINNNPDGWFTLFGSGPYRGKGLVLGTDSEGESVSPKIAYSKLVAAVGFPSDAQVALMLG